MLVGTTLVVVLALVRLDDLVSAPRELPGVVVDHAVVVLAGVVVVRGAVRRAVSVVRWFIEPVESCPACGHDRLEHDVHTSTCGECEHEVEHEDPGAPATPCAARPPAGTPTVSRG